MNITVGAPWKSLQDVHDHLVKVQPDESVINVYVPSTNGQSTVWEYWQPDQQIVIRPKGTSVQKGALATPKPGWWLSYQPKVGRNTSLSALQNSLTVIGLTVTNYESGGIEFSPKADGDKYDAGNITWLGGLVVKGVKFKRLGSYWAGVTDWDEGRFGVAGVLMRGCTKALIYGCEFDTLVNDKVESQGKILKQGPGMIHGVYIRDHSSGVSVMCNRFANISGDPIRFTNGSNGNAVSVNTSFNAGERAFVSDWHRPTEAPSRKNVVTDNVVGNLYNSTTKAPMTWYL